MTSGIAAVQSRIAEIQGRFAMPVARTAPASAPSAGASAAGTSAAGAPALSDGLGTRSFASLLASSTAQLGGPAATSGVTGRSAGSATGAAVVAKAQEHLGTPYVWGGSAPGGFDCSGLMQWTYKQFGIDIPRVSRDQAKAGREVSAAEAQPGDLVFFSRKRPAPDHIGMYAGNGQWVVAPKTGDVVKMQAVDIAKATTIRRILPDDATPAASPVAPTGALQRTPAATGGTPYADLFAEAGARHGVSPALLTAVARAESAFNPAARSPAGAQGLMQFMPATAKGLGIDPWKPTEAVDGAARLLKQHLGRFGSTELALAAYNAGPGAVLKHGGIPPYRETQDYVRKIMTEMRAGTA